MKPIKDVPATPDATEPKSTLTSHTLVTTPDNRSKIQAFMPKIMDTPQIKPQEMKVSDPCTAKMFQFQTKAVESPTNSPMKLSQPIRPRPMAAITDSVNEESPPLDILVLYPTDSSEAKELFSKRYVSAEDRYRALEARDKLLRASE